MKREDRKKTVGHRIPGRCPECGRGIIGNELGDKWCSGCDYVEHGEKSRPEPEGDSSSVA